MTLYEKSINILELPAVLEMLAGEAVCASAKEAVKELRPGDNIYEIRREQAETSAAKKYMSVRGGPSFSGTKDVSAALSRADIGGMLNTRELLDIAGVLRAARQVQAYASAEKEGINELDYLFSALRPNKYLEEKITASIVNEDEIADGASSELTSIRRQMRIAGDRVRQSLQKIISSSYYAKALQEPIITMRNDRYVVPVKADHKSSVPGLVHDISSSGATLFIEPMSAVQANNEIRELLSKEKNEIDRILMAMSAEASGCGEDIICDFNVLTQLDVIFAKAKLSYKLDGSEPEISENGEIILRKARHPLLPQKTAVPIDVRLGGDFDTLMITGPNTGGKTVSIKTIGLHCVMALCGLHIPAGDGSCIPVFKKILADIGDEQSIEQSLSTFSSHMTNIVKILKECGEDTLILFDELGAGTDPVEGAALAEAIIEYARQLGAKIAATTHYAELKVYATVTPGVQNACCEFDVETLRPTFRLLIGIPGKSNAFAISSRLGIMDTIIEDAKKHIDSESLNFEEVLQELETTRQQMEKERAETRRLLEEARKKEKETEEYRKLIKAEKEKAAVLAKREANDIIEQARRAAEDTFDELNEMRKEARRKDNWQDSNAKRADIRHRLNQAEDEIDYSETAVEEDVPSGPVKAGDTVEIKSIGSKAQVLSVEPDGTLQLQAGIMKITAKEGDVRLVETASAKQLRTVSQTADIKLRKLDVKPEVDLRGLMSDEAVSVMERYLDSAQLAKLNIVTVIHGKGTGALRKAVHQNLKRNRQVKSFRLGRYGEGEDGVTIVELR